MGRESQVRTLALNLTLLALKMWAYSPQNRQNRYFLVTICRKGVCPLNGFLSNLAWGRVSQDCTLTPNFFRCRFKNVGLEPLKSQKLVILFLVYICPIGVYPFKHFYKILRGEGLLGPHGHANFHHCGSKNVALRLPKSPKIAIFGINVPPRKNPGVHRET